MSDTIGSVIESGEGLSSRESYVDSNSQSTNADSERIVGSENGTGKPETINGFETAEPRTERIDSRGPDGVRLTKSGRPDRRGRPRGESYRTETTKTTLGVALDNISLAGLLLGIHSMAAKMLDNPIWEIEKSEAEDLSKAAQGVMKEYGHVVSPKTAAWIQLCVTCGAVYGTRIAAVSMMKPKTVRGTVLSDANGAPKPPVYVAPDPPVPHGDLN